MLIKEWDRIDWTWGRYTFRIVQYTDRWWGIAKLTTAKPCLRWQLNLGTLGIRFEYR